MFEDVDVQVENRRENRIGCVEKILLGIDLYFRDRSCSSRKSNLGAPFLEFG